MPRGKRVSPAERREWLTRFEQGTSVSDIARDAKRAVSAVRTHISTARQEREQGEAKAYLTRKAYEEHYNDLLAAGAEVASRGAAWRSGPVSLSADIRSRLLVQALEEHIPGSPLWELWGEIEKLSRDLVESEIEIKDQVTQLASERLPEINVDGVAASIKTALTLAPTLLAEADSWYRVEEEPDGIVLVWGAHRLAGGGSSESRIQEIRQWHSGLWREPRPLSMDLTKLIKGYRDLTARGDSLLGASNEEVERLRLRRVLPGRCSFCPDAPVGQTSRRRKTRTQTLSKGSQS